MIDGLVSTNVYVDGKLKETAVKSNHPKRIEEDKGGSSGWPQEQVGGFRSALLIGYKPFVITYFSQKCTV
jgi:hypothetical protein